MPLEKLNPSKLSDTSAVMALFEANYKAALPDELEQAKAQAKTETASMGMPMPLFDSQLTLGNFCSQWTTIRAFLTKILWAARWFAPGPAAMATAFLKTFEATVLPIVCPVPPAE